MHSVFNGSVFRYLRPKAKSEDGSLRFLTCMHRNGNPPLSSRPCRFCCDEKHREIRIDRLLRVKIRGGYINLKVRGKRMGTNENYLYSKWLAELAEKFGDAPALSCNERTMSFREIRDASYRFALALYKMGLQKGDKVMLLSYNGVEYMTAIFGIAMAGGTAALVNYSLNASEVTQLTELVDGRWALIGENHVSDGDKAAAKAAFTEGGVSEDHVIDLNELFEQCMDPSNPVDEEEFKALKDRVSPSDTQIIIFTSGTTSLPKAVQLSSCAVLSNAYASLKATEKDTYDTGIIPLPLFHVYGLIFAHAWMFQGAHTYLVSMIKPEVIKDLIVQHKIRHCASVPSVYSDLVSLPDFENVAKVLKTCIVGGGFANPSEMLTLENLLEDGKVLVGYGQSENSAVITVNRSDDPIERRYNTVGKFLDNIDARIWDREKGFLEPGEVGELILRSPSIMNGYLGLPQEMQAVDSDGWLHTGDLAVVDEYGLVRLMGRIKEIIIRKGENISPFEVETALLAEPSVREVKVFGMPHPLWGESVEACVVFNGEAPEEESLREFLSQHIAKFKIPSHFFVFSSFPLTANGKLDVRRLKESVIKQLNEEEESSKAE